MRRENELCSDLRARTLQGGTCMAVATLLALPLAHSAEIETGNPNLKVRWDNTIKYTGGFRVKERSVALANDMAQGGNQGDGDSNFGKGLISNRLDLLSELDLTYQNVGARISGAAWYDTVYNRATSNNELPFLYNASSVPANEFPDATRKLHGAKAELLDAFLFAKGDIDGTTATIRAGRHALIYGESLFFGNNGIAGTMAPVDVVKLLSVPGSQFKEIIRPVGQISGQWQLQSNLSLGAFYQYQWQKTVLAGAGSYFSGADFLDAGGERLFTGPGTSELHGADRQPRNSGQGGAQLRWSPEGSGVDLGLYAVHYSDKTPNVVLSPLTGIYRLFYQQNIKAFGASASTTLGSANIALEASVRHNAPLVNSGTADLFGLVPVAFGGPAQAADNDGNPSYPIGKTAHLNLSTLYQLPVFAYVPESTMAAELAWNRTTSVKRNAAALDPNADRDAWSMRGVYEATFRQALSGFDLSLPVGLSYSPKGRSSAVSAFGVHHGGDMSVGLNGVYLSTWYFGLNFTHFYGPESTAVVLHGAGTAYTYKQNLKDRDFVSISLRRTW